MKKIVDTLPKIYKINKIHNRQMFLSFVYEYTLKYEIVQTHRLHT